MKTTIDDLYNNRKLEEFGINNTLNMVEIKKLNENEYSEFRINAMAEVKANNPELYNQLVNKIIKEEGANMKKEDKTAISNEIIALLDAKGITDEAKRAICGISWKVFSGRCKTKKTE